MPTPSTIVFDLIPPHRPGLDDVGGAAKVDDSEFLADPPTMVSGNDVNQWAALCVALGKVIPVCVVSFAFSAGSYSVSSVGSVVSAVTPSTFAVSSAAAGNVGVSWPANTFPLSGIPPTAYPLANHLGITHPMVANTSPVVSNTTDVYIFDQNTFANVDYPFVLIFY